MKNFKKSLILAGSLLAFSFTMCASVSAALFEFDPQDKAIGLDQDFDVALLLSADRPVNAVEVSLVVPKGLTPTMTSDGNSIVNFWIEKPTFDPVKRRLAFSGLIPGGFTGKQGRVLVMTFKADTGGALELAIDRAASKLLLNDSLGTEEPIEAEPLILNALEGRENLRNLIPDQTAPEPFVPVIAQENELYGGAWTLIFASQDKESGLAGFEIQESSWNRPSSVRWKPAISPYRLEDQSLHSYIFVKARDNRGNERIVTVSPKFGERPSHLALWAGIFAVCIIALVSIVRRYILRK